MVKRKREESDEDILKKLADIQAELTKRRRHKSTPPQRRRIYLISSEDESDETDNATPTHAASSLADTIEASTSSAGGGVDETPQDQMEIELDNEILHLLGDAPKVTSQLGTKVHKDIALRWEEILHKGLPKDTKESILKENLVPANCESLVPPVLNAEVKAALPESLIKRDTFLVERQKQIGIALAALANATDMLIKKDDSSKILKQMSDAGRLLCDIHYNETKSRRSFIISATNTNMKEALLETKRNKYLFGDNVSETVKSAKNIQRSGADLKQFHKNTFHSQKFKKSNFYRNKSLNTRAPQRKVSGKPEVGKPRTPAATAAATTTRAATKHSASTRRTSPPPRMTSRRY